jgi:hypothetical protein
MNGTLHLQAPWEEVKEKLKEINTQLTDGDLVYEPGKEDQLLKRLATRLKKDGSAVKALIESISSNRGQAS